MKNIHNCIHNTNKHQKFTYIFNIDSTEAHYIFKECCNVNNDNDINRIAQKIIDMTTTLIIADYINDGWDCPTFDDKYGRFNPELKISSKKIALIDVAKELVLQVKEGKLKIF